MSKKHMGLSVVIVVLLLICITSLALRRNRKPSEAYITRLVSLFQLPPPILQVSPDNEQVAVVQPLVGNKWYVQREG